MKHISIEHSVLAENDDIYLRLFIEAEYVEVDASINHDFGNEDIKDFKPVSADLLYAINPETGDQVSQDVIFEHSDFIIDSIDKFLKYDLPRPLKIKL